jgi:heat shock protein HtpX
MAETFQTLISRNRRNSAILVAVFMAVFLAIGGLIGYVWGSYQPMSPRPSPSQPARVPPRAVPSEGPEAGAGALHEADRLDEASRRENERREAEYQEAMRRYDRARWGFTITVALGAAGVAFLLTLLSYYKGGGMLLAMSNAREIGKGDDPQLFNVVEELCLAAGLPMPRICLIDDKAMNAFATGRDPKHAAVAITTGLREKLTRDELQGVLGHELCHVRHRDILFATLIAVMVGTLVILCDVFLRGMQWGAYGRGRRGRDEDRGGGGVKVVLAIVAIVLAIIAPILAKIIELAISRQREYLADAGSVGLTRNPDGLANALAKLGGDSELLRVANRATAPLYIVDPIKHLEDHLEEKSGSVFDTHPPIRNRICRLLALHQ